MVITSEPQPVVRIFCLHWPASSFTFSTAKVEACLLMIISPTRKRTMTRFNGRWHCSIQVKEKGSWWCGEAIECAGSVKVPLENTWDPYKFEGQSLCVWVCE